MENLGELNVNSGESFEGFVFSPDHPFAENTKENFLQITIINKVPIFTSCAQRHGLLKGRVLVLVGTVWSSEPKNCILSILKQFKQFRQFKQFLKNSVKTVLLSTVLPRLVIIKRGYLLLLMMITGHRSS